MVDPYNGNDPEELTAQYVVRAFPCVRQRQGKGAGVCDGAGMSSMLIISGLASLIFQSGVCHSTGVHLDGVPPVGSPVKAVVRRMSGA